jgi:hypothetical protein
MKYIFLLVVFVASSLLYAADSPTNWKEEDITYESLLHSWSNHVAAFEKLFQFRKITTFLEFGMGRGTKYFIDNCDRVISIELVGATGAPKLLPYSLKTVEMFWHHANWHPHLLRCSPLMDHYDVMARQAIIASTNFDVYLKEVESICTWAIGENPPDLVFIDQGLLPRGDFINALFGKVNIIAAHDTGPAHPHVKWYAYDHVKQDPNYVAIFCKKGGVTFWIKKDDKALIEYMKKACLE